VTASVRRRVEASNPAHLALCHGRRRLTSAGRTCDREVVAMRFRAARSPVPRVGAVEEVNREACRGSAQPPVTLSSIVSVKGPGSRRPSER
jgi:hypothetical protein